MGLIFRTRKPPRTFGHGDGCNILVAGRDRGALRTIPLPAEVIERAVRAVGRDAAYVEAHDDGLDIARGNRRELLATAWRDRANVNGEAARIALAAERIGEDEVALQYARRAIHGQKQREDYQHGVAHNAGLVALHFGLLDLALDAFYVAVNTYLRTVAVIPEWDSTGLQGHYNGAALAFEHGGDIRLQRRWTDLATTPAPPIFELQPYLEADRYWRRAAATRAEAGRDLALTAIHRIAPKLRLLTEANLAVPQVRSDMEAELRAEAARQQLCFTPVSAEEPHQWREWGWGYEPEWPYIGVFTGALANDGLGEARFLLADQSVVLVVSYLGPMEGNRQVLQIGHWSRAG